MPESGNLGAAIGPGSISNGHINHFEVQFGTSEDQVKVSEGVKVAKVVALSHEPLIVVFGQHLGSAERIRNPLVEEP